jgi:tetratricopeptide (TPR) repeat protein
MKRWVLKSVLLCGLIFSWMPERVWAADVDWNNCVQNDDQNLSIKGCSAVLDRGSAESSGNRAIAYNDRGIAYRLKGDYDRAFADYDQAIKLDPKYEHAYVNRGLAHYNKGDYDRAVADYDQAIRLDPKDEGAYFNRGLAYYYKGDHDRAMADYDQAIRLDPKDARAYTNRGLAYSNKGDYDHAIADYDRAIQLDPAFATAYYNRGIACDNKGDFNRAIADYDQAIKLNPKYTFAYFNRGIAYKHKGDYDRAIADYDQAIQLDPKDPDTYDNRGLAYELRGDAAPARANFETALALRPGDNVATAGLARLAAKAPAIAAPVATVHSCAGLGKRVALVIGNSRYPGTAALTNPVNDADDVSAVLRDTLCFSVIEAKDATREVFSHKIGEFADAAQGADIALFYYAGHGMQFEQTNYLLPVDSKMANEFEAIHDNISAQDVITMLESRAKVALVFLDACRNNPIEQDFRRRIAALGRSIGETRGLAPMASHGSETLVVFATRPNERADDGTGRNSPFSQAFLKHIATPGKDIELVVRDISASVRANTNGRQTPQRLTELEHGVILVPAR